MATRTSTKRSQHPPGEPPKVRELSPEESAEEFERQARRYLQMSDEEFLRRWDAREFPDTEDSRRWLGGVAYPARSLTVLHGAPKSHRSCSRRSATAFNSRTPASPETS